MSKIYALIGPPASGKSSIVKQLRAEHNVCSLLSHTTRPPKPGEENGVNYYFVDKEQFSRMQFIEKASYADHSYGLSKEEVLSKVKDHEISIIDISMAGFDHLKKLLGERVESIYILVDKDTIINRYLDSGDDPSEIIKRIEYAEKRGEFDNWRAADYVVKNGRSIEAAVRQVRAIMNI